MFHCIDAPSELRGEFSTATVCVGDYYGGPLQVLVDYSVFGSSGPVLFSGTAEWSAISYYSRKGKVSARGFLVVSPSEFP